MLTTAERPIAINADEPCKLVSFVQNPRKLHEKYTAHYIRGKFHSESYKIENTEGENKKILHHPFIFCQTLSPRSLSDSFSPVLRCWPHHPPFACPCHSESRWIQAMSRSASHHRGVTSRTSGWFDRSSILSRVSHQERRSTWWLFSFAIHCFQIRTYSLITTSATTGMAFVNILLYSAGWMSAPSASRTFGTTTGTLSNWKRSMTVR